MKNEKRPFLISRVGTRYVNFRNTFLNSFVKVLSPVGIVAGMGNGSVAVLVVTGGSWERLGWASSWMGIETIGGVVVESDRFGSLTWPWTGGGTDSSSGSSAAFSTYWGGGT